MSSSAQRQAMSQRHEIGHRTAIFDLDGTLTRRDSFLAFLTTFGRRHARYAALARLPLRLSTYLVGTVADFQLKQTLIREFVSACDQETVDRHVEWFCDCWLPKALHPIGSRLLEAHLANGDRVILLSASPDIFVPKIGQRLGISETVCTRIEIRNNHWTGEILGANCKGRNKLDRIRSYLGVKEAPENSFAYGDSTSDRYVLQWVHHGAWINRRGLKPVNGLDTSAFPLGDAVDENAGNRNFTSNAECSSDSECG